MLYQRLVLICLTLLLTTSCGGLRATQEATTSAVCEPTREARQAHAGALVRLPPSSPEAREARATGAVALNGIASGCDEIKRERE